MSNRKKSRRGRGAPLRGASGDDLFERALRGDDESPQKTFDPRTDRKTLQLCRQVERALMLALAGECGDDLLRDVFVDSVDPAGGGGHLHDQQWAREYANANRIAMNQQVIDLMRQLFKIDPVESLSIACDHNHLQLEEHFGQPMLVHRKGAMPAFAGQAGIVPGSMGTFSYHVTGKGCKMALRSSAHGAGRLLSRHAARERFNRRDLQGQMQEVWFDPRITDAMREESPKSYKDVRAVLRAQKELVEIDRVLKPVLVYKGSG